MKREYTTPTGSFPVLYDEMSQQSHLLIAGATGSGKSSVINGIIYRLLYKSPASVQFAFIDVKRVELIDYRRLPHCIGYADSVQDSINLLVSTLQTIETRFKRMQTARVKLYPGSDLYIIIDELADLMIAGKRELIPLIQRIAQIGRAARVHLIVATQCPIAAILPTQIKCNFDARVALKTATNQDSRNIIGLSGCEAFPDPAIDGIAYGYYRRGSRADICKLPLIPHEDIQRLIKYWMCHRPRLKLF